MVQVKFSKLQLEILANIATWVLFCLRLFCFYSFILLVELETEVCSQSGIFMGTV